MRRRAILAVCMVLAVLGGACSDGPTTSRRGLPAAMAAAGDSMTRGYNVGPCCVWADGPEYSWSTGDNTRVDSHYQRLLAMNPRFREFNVAKTGAKVSDLDRQLRLAATYHADYLTIMIGANDLLAVLGRGEHECHADPAAMTPVATFRAQFRKALTHFTETRPHADVLVASIPNIPRLWGIFSQDPGVIDVWNKRSSCEVILGDHRADAAIRLAGARLVAYNDVMAEVCSSFTRCRWDGGAVFRYPFAKADFSSVDYFHPNPSGQRRIAALTWRAGFWA
jgi:lysophospholipase L1-like esterase